MPTLTQHSITVFDLDDIVEDNLQVVVSQDEHGELVTVKCNSSCYYGKLDFVMNLDMAEAVAKAMLEQVKFIKENQ